MLSAFCAERFTGSRYTYILSDIRDFGLCGIELSAIAGNMTAARIILSYFYHEFQCLYMTERHNVEAYIPDEDIQRLRAWKQRTGRTWESSYRSGSPTSGRRGDSIPGTATCEECGHSWELKKSLDTYRVGPKCSECGSTEVDAEQPTRTTSKPTPTPGRRAPRRHHHLLVPAEHAAGILKIGDAFDVVEQCRVRVVGVVTRVRACIRRHAPSCQGVAINPPTDSTVLVTATEASGCWLPLRAGAAPRRPASRQVGPEPLQSGRVSRIEPYYRRDDGAPEDRGFE